MLSNPMNAVFSAVVLAVLSLTRAAPSLSQHGKQALTQKQAFLHTDSTFSGQDLEHFADNLVGIEESKSQNQGSINPFATQAHPQSGLMCGITEVVGAHTDKYEDCPANCPYFAQNRKDTQHCTFLCVAGSECGLWNPNKPIPDTIKNSKTCRGPMVPFCSEPTLDGKDTCAVCSNGYALWPEDGSCYFKYWTPLIILSAILVVLATVLIAWVVDLCCREAINDPAVTKAEEWRNQSKILKPRSDTQTRSIWPLSTNLITEDVAGAGMLLHFNFQLFFIVWPFCVALVWTALACFHNELFILGTRKFGTPRHNCILVAWGYETQQRLMWTKVFFLIVVYIGSFVSFTLFFVRQYRANARIDAQEKTMRDFAVELRGLPELPGSSAEVEEDIKKAVEVATGVKPIGISIAWRFDEVEDKITFENRLDLDEQQFKLDPARRPPAQYDEPEPTMGMNKLHTWMYKQEKSVLGPGEEDNRPIEELLKTLKTSDTAFAVFNTEEDRDKAFDKKTVKFETSKYGLEPQVGTINLEMLQVVNEPANVNWQNFGDSDPTLQMIGFLKGFFKVYVPALLLWFFGFYVPYAISLYYFNYDNGAELPGYYGLIFTIVICGGNATMYVVCDICCDMIGFRYKDTKQVTYMLMYLVACMINVFLDMVVTYYTAMKVMVGLDFRTYHGTRLADIDTFTEQFETYAMQRSLGENTYRYAWPSTFFLCFVLEPFVTILIPLQIGKVIVRTHREIQGTCAEAYMMAFEFDLGRYADILLNVFLGILIFYFPGGYIWTLFFAMCFSHCFIYCFDHWRVLSVIPYVKIVSNQVDWWAQVMMCGCCALILGCLVFKANCETYVNYCLQDAPLVGSCFIAGILHFIVHFLLLIYLVPMLGTKEPKQNEGMTFETVAKDEPRTWFSVNPVHCLRSKYIHGDKPHCRLCYFGKEHLLEVNEKIGCHFFDKAAEADDDFASMRKSMSLKG